MDQQTNQTADALAAVTHQLHHLTHTYLQPLLTELKQQSQGHPLPETDLAQTAYYTARRLHEISYHAAYNQYHNALSRVHARAFLGPDESLVQDALDVFQDALCDLQATEQNQTSEAYEQVGWDVGHEIDGVKVDHPQYAEAFHVLVKRRQDWAADPANMKMSLDFIERTLGEIVRLCTAHYVLTNRMVPEAHFEHRDFHAKDEVYIDDAAVVGYLHGLFSAVKRHEVAGFLGQDAQTVIRSVFS